MSAGDPTAEDIKALILKKAIDRFVQYGFGKTTMVEIARDCGMSAGNLYRYFESKFDIGVGVAQGYIAQAEQILKDVMQRPGLKPGRRLEAFVLEKLRFMHRHIIDQPMCRTWSTTSWMNVGIWWKATGRFKAVSYRKFFPKATGPANSKLPMWGRPPILFMP